MPAVYTHYLFGQKVLEKANKNLKNEIEKNLNYYNMFNQGFDNLYYYPLKWTYYRNLGIRSHKKKVDLFFKNTIQYIKDHHLIDNSIYTNMIYGFINHYTLDTIVHPFINYQVINIKISHTNIEFMLDGYYYLNNNKEKWRGRIYKVLMPKLKFDKNLLALLNYVFLNTHNEKNVGYIFQKSHNIGYLGYRYFINTYFKLVCYFYKLFPKRNNNKLRINECNDTLLNTFKDSWHHPNNENKIYNYSLKELYDYALKIATKTNELAYKVIHNNEDITKLLEEIKKINIDNI